MAKAVGFLERMIKDREKPTLTYAGVAMTVSTVVHIHAMIRSDQKDLLKSYAEQNGKISLSEALRAYLDETKTLLSIAAAGARSPQLSREATP